MIDELLEQGYMKTACKKMKGNRFSCVVLKVDKKELDRKDRIMVLKN